MGKKGKKRQLCEDDATDSKSIVKKTEDAGNFPKKKKLKTSADNVAITKTQEIKVVSNTDGTERNSKKSKKKQAKKQKNAESSLSEKSIHLQNNVEKLKIAIEDDKTSINNYSRRKEKLKQKRKNNIEMRKKVRKEEGNFSSVNKLSVEEMKKKIAEIQARETISKTALRKLHVLKKKLSVEEGTTNDTFAPKSTIDTTQGDTSNKKFKKDFPMTEIISQKDTKNTKRNKEKNVNKKLKKDVSIKNEDVVVKENSEFNMLNKSKKERLETSKIREQPLFIEDRQGSLLEKSNKKKNNIKNNKKKNKNNAEESEVSRVKRILEEVLTKKNQKTEKVDVQNGDKEKDSENHEEYKKLAENLNSKNSYENDDSDDEEDIDTEYSEKDNIETKINKSNITMKTNKKIEQSMFDNTEEDDEDDEDDEDEDEEDKEDEEEEKSDSAEAENNKSQQSSMKETIKNDQLKDFRVQTLKQINQNADTAKKQRYVLFVGNLSYDATPVDIKKHFLTKVDKVKDIRIPPKPGSNTPRGFAYVELENSVDYEKALSLHDTFINGRKINVQYTASGSKHIWNRQEIVHKNKKLHAMRKAGKLAGSKKNFQKRSFRRKPDKKLKTKS